MKNRRFIIQQITYAINIILITIPFVCVWYLFYAQRIAMPFYRRGNWVIILIFLVLYGIFSSMHDGFFIPIASKLDTIYGQALGVTLTNCVMYLIIFVLTQVLPNPLPLLAAFAAEIVIVLLFTLLSYKVFMWACPPYTTAIVYGTKPRVQELIDDYNLSKVFKTAAVYSIESCLHDLKALDPVETVFITDVNSHDRNIVIKYCQLHGKSVFLIPRIGDAIMAGAKRVHMFNLPFLKVETYGPSLLFLFVKRLFDIVLSSIALIVLSPLFLVVAVCIKCTDKGPVLYKQTRLTQNGKEFTLLKFRSMRVDAEKDGVARLSMGENDDRITPIGRILRRYRMDELPQIICILRGDMSICGPRPERPEIAREYEKTLPEFRLRLQMKAGLTGYAQVYGKYNTSPYDKLLMDLMYIAHPSILIDANIILATIKTFFQPESTEGFSVNMEYPGKAAREEAKAREPDGSASPGSKYEKES